MYLDYYGLGRKPFSITPDPSFLFLSNKHREGLAHLIYGTSSDSSFVVLSGEIGTGKTMLCRSLLDNPPEDIHVALILNPLQTPAELLSSICDEFGIGYRGDSNSRKLFVDRINVFLLQRYAQNQRCILIIDEAQNLSVETLEQVRLLTNLESGEHKLLKIILIGQPELRTLLDKPELRQLKQRITGRYHLLPLSEKETSIYITHRMIKAGGSAEVFSQKAANQIHKLSGGVPRLINLIADRTLLGGFALNQPHIDKKLVDTAGKELLDTRKSKTIRQPNMLTLASLLLGFTAISLAAWNMFLQNGDSPDPENTAEVVINAPSPEPVPVATKPDETPSAKPMDSLPIIIENQEPIEDSGETTITTQETEPDPVINQDNEIEPDSIVEKEERSFQNITELLSEQQNSPDAIDSLFVRWGIPPRSLAGTTACEKAESVNLGCIISKGSFTELLAYDRPAVLELSSGQNERHQILLAEIAGDVAEIVIDGQSQTTRIDDLLQHWNGEYLLLWRLPPNGKKVLQANDQGSSIAWLSNNINQALGRAADADTAEIYDDQLRRQVIEFQTSTGLTVDGLAGPDTLIKLATIVNADSTPILVKATVMDTE